MRDTLTEIKFQIYEIFDSTVTRLTNWSVARWIEPILPIRRVLRGIRSSWGQPGSKDGWLVDRLFRLTRPEDPSQFIDEGTWRDLEFPAIFKMMDSTITRLGSQYLFRQMRTYHNDSAQLDVLYESYETLRQNRRLREQLQLVLSGLDADSAAGIVDRLSEELPEGLRRRPLVALWSLSSIALIIGTFTHVIAPAAAILILAINGIAIARTASRRYSQIETFKSMYRMVRVAERLSRVRLDTNVPQLAALAADRKNLARARHAFRWFGILDMLPLGLGTWLNILFLAEWLAYLYTADRVNAVRADLHAIYERVGSLDAAIAVASSIERFRIHCKPVIGNLGSIEIEGAYHPLLARPVANSLKLVNRSALISGSNMAGKTSFIKMVAVNVIVGRTLGFCFARRAIIPACRVMACIGREHSVESGKSRYFAEVEAILSLLQHAEVKASLLAVIDEPFSGTNTSERIAAAKAVLSALSSCSLVLATTHDVELQSLLRQQFEMFHFTENPEIEGFFDFRLRSGPCTEGNALRLLEKVGLPAAVIAEAFELVGFVHEPSKLIGACDG